MRPVAAFQSSLFQIPDQLFALPVLGQLMLLQILIIPGEAGVVAHPDLQATGSQICNLGSGIIDELLVM